MKNDIRIFDNPEFGKVRVIMDQNNEPLFCLSDVCKVLGLLQGDVRRRLDDGLVSTQPITDSIGRQQISNFVNEDGLYDTILDSRKPEAKKFRKWVTSEVLPSIRKTGGYMVALPEETNEELLARAVLVAKDAIKRRDEKIHKLERDNEEANKTISELRPKAELMEKLLDTDGNVDIGQAAKMLNLPFGRNILFKKLREKGILFRDRNEPKQRYIDQKLFTMKNKIIERSGYNNFTVPKILVTKKGLEFLDKLFKKETGSGQIVLPGFC